MAIQSTSSTSEICPAAAGPAPAHPPAPSSASAAAAAEVLSTQIRDTRNLLTDNRGLYEKYLWQQIGEFAPECSLFLQHAGLREEVRLVIGTPNPLELEEILLAAARKPGRSPTQKMASFRIVEQVLNKPGFTENSSGPIGLALLWASRNGHEAIVDALIRCPGFRNISVNMIRWSLINAAEDGNTYILNALLRCSRSNEILPHIFRSALKTARRNGHGECVSALLLHFR